jgi:hypothetical protein
MISWESISWRSGMYITIKWLESEIWATWILNGYCYIFCIQTRHEKGHIGISWKYQRFCTAFIHVIVADSSKGVCLYSG